MKFSGFIFDCLNLLHYRCHKVNLKRAGSYIDSSICFRTRNATINPINRDDDKCFQQAATLILNHNKFVKYSARISKKKPLLTNIFSKT